MKLPDPSSTEADRHLIARGPSKRPLITRRFVDSTSITNPGCPVFSCLRVGKLHLLGTLWPVGDDHLGLTSVERAHDRLRHVLRAVGGEPAASLGHAPGSQPLVELGGGDRGIDY